MREIKFRAWDKELKGMLEKDDFEDTELEDYIYHSPKQIVLMQYTGLKDRTGREIYEGDVVRHDSSRVCRVSWFKGEHYTGWDLTALNGKGRAPHPMWKDLEVIGNVYEHPELLEKERTP